jgi:hypothetical protein
MTRCGCAVVCSAILLACGSPAGNDPASANGAGSVSNNLPAPIEPIPDDPAVCMPSIRPHPNLSPEPVRPCTQQDVSPDVQSTFRYDAPGRVIYRDSRYGHLQVDEVYRSEDSADTRTETTTSNGIVGKLRTTQLKNGVPIESDDFTGTGSGALQLYSHSTWNYDASGRQTSVVTQGSDFRVIERDYYDSAGRLYLAYWSQPLASGGTFNRWRLRSWFANGALARDALDCDLAGMCGRVEDRWDPCGNPTSSARVTANGRGSRWIDWTWDAAGSPFARQDRWTGAASEWSSTESYAVDGAGRVASSAIVTVNPPAYPAIPDRHSVYSYDSAGRATGREVDGQVDFHALFDDAGNLLERGAGSALTRWTYDSCGR